MKLNKKEKEWVATVQAALDKCPSDRIGFATVGDDYLTLFDVRGMDKITAALLRSNSDFIAVADELGLVAIETLTFPQPVESTAG